MAVFFVNKFVWHINFAAALTRNTHLYSFILTYFHDYDITDMGLICLITNIGVKFIACHIKYSQSQYRIAASVFILDLITVSSHVRNTMFPLL